MPPTSKKESMLPVISILARRDFLFKALLCFLFYLYPALSHADTIYLSAAASMTDAVRQITAQFRQSHPQLKLFENYASSGALAGQIAHGAPADIYLSANPRWMDYLIAKGSIVAETKKVLAWNSLVFLGRAAPAPKDMEDLLQLQKIAIGTPQYVPVGSYAKKAMEAAAIYPRLKQQNRLVHAKDARQALIYADRGEVDGAFVYLTDAKLAEKAEIHFAVDKRLHPPIIYPMGLTAKGSKNQQALLLYTFLQTAEAAKTLREYGFLIPKEEVE